MIARSFYGFGELDELVLVYATTIHKSQGSEYPAVVIPLTTQHSLMLQRNVGLWWMMANASRRSVKFLPRFPRVFRTPVDVNVHIMAEEGGFEPLVA
jgi:hypothetical protein